MTETGSDPVNPDGGRVYHASAHADPRLAGQGEFYRQITEDIHRQNPQHDPIKILTISAPVDPAVELPYLREYIVAYAVKEDGSGLEQWWGRLTEEQQGQLKRAVRAYPADPSIVPLLVSAGELLSSSWTATSIADSPHSIAIHDPLKSFVESKIDDE